MYKQLIQRKKKEYTLKLWDNLIQATKQNNSSLFWRLISDKRHKNISPRDSCIPPDKWIVFFQKLYDHLQITPVTPIEKLQTWTPVSQKEIKSHIARLKNGKAAGFDGIPVEILKENSDWWATFLATLFTYIDSTGRIPKDWRTAIVVPIFKKGNKIQQTIDLLAF